MANEHGNIFIHLPSGCLFSSVFNLTLKKVLKLCVTGYLWRESPIDRLFYLTKGQYYEKR